jgi:Fur family transcriptional regulator, stress-responsive regulator
LVIARRSAAVTCPGTVRVRSSGALAGSSVGRTPDFGSGGRRFDPCPASHKPAGRERCRDGRWSAGKARDRHARGPPPSGQAVTPGVELSLDSFQDRFYNAEVSDKAPVSEEVGGDSEALLRRHGLQVTAQRLAVLRAVAARPHSTAEGIDTVVRAEIGAISRQAVYDALSVFTDKGILRRIQPAGSPTRYENRVGDNHHHLICRICSQMVDVDCAVGDAPCLTAVESRGYDIDEAEVIYWGRCPDCVAAASGSSAG